MSYKKFVIISIVLICLILSLTLFFTSSIPNRKMLLGLMNLFKSTETKTDLVFAIEKLIDGQDGILIEITDNNICYWIRPTMNETKYLLEINEYESTNDMRGCVGFLKSTKYIVLDHPVNLRGTDCVCGGMKYLLEWKAGGLKITR